MRGIGRRPVTPCIEGLIYENARALEVGLGMEMVGSDIRAYISLLGQEWLDELLRFEEMQV